MVLQHLVASAATHTTVWAGAQRQWLRLRQAVATAGASTTATAAVVVVVVVVVVAQQ